MDDYRAIESLLYRYTEYMDAGDFAAIGRLFARGRIVAPAADKAFIGAAEVQALYEASARLYPDGTPRTQHLTSNVRIELDESRREARAWSRFTVFQAVERLPLQAVIAGRYEDRLACDSDGWYFVERTMRTDLLGDLSHHLQYELPR
ncbi:MAG: nuclear transport factor 2 family protein [Solimonas sp.]